MERKRCQLCHRRKVLLKLTRVIKKTIYYTEISIEEGDHEVRFGKTY